MSYRGEGGHTWTRIALPEEGFEIQHVLHHQRYRLASFGKYQEEFAL